MKRNGLAFVIVETSPSDSLSRSQYSRNSVVQLYSK